MAGRCGEWKCGWSDDVAGLEVECSERAGFGGGWWLWSTKKVLTCWTKALSSGTYIRTIIHCVAIIKHHFI